MQYQICEWMRHRMAIDSGLSTSKADGTMGEIVSPVEFNQCGEIPYTVIRNGVKETKTVTAAVTEKTENDSKQSDADINDDDPVTKGTYSFILTYVPAK